MSRPPLPKSSGLPPRPPVDAVVAEGLRLHQSGKPAEAARLYEQALVRDPGHAAANHLLGLIRLQQGNADDAVRLITVATRRNPGDAGYLANLGAALNAAGRPAEAVEALDRAIAIKPGFAGAHSNRGMSLKALGRLDDAASSYREAIALGPGEAGFRYNLANVLAELGDIAEAEDQYREALRLRPVYPAAAAALSRLLEQSARPAAAAEAARAALAATPREPELHYRLGRALYAARDLAGADAAYRAALNLRPSFGEVLLALSEMTVHDARDVDVAALERVTADPAVAPEDRIFAGFGLGRALFDLGEHDRSVSAYLDANRLRRSRMSVSIEAAVAHLEQVGAAFESLPPGDTGFTEAAPIFLVGLPRSGKSTVEALLAQDPRFAPVGERLSLGRAIARIAGSRPIGDLDADSFAAVGRDYIEDVAATIPPGTVAVDTMPPNFGLVGHIRMALPNARVIHCRRPPAPHVLAIFEKYLTGRGYEYSADLSELVTYYAAYLSLMRRWHRLYPGFVLDLDLADFAGNPESRRRFADFTGFTAPESPDATLLPISEPRLGTMSSERLRTLRAAQLDAWRAAGPDLVQALDATPYP